jgi:hypothetical protein
VVDHPHRTRETDTPEMIQAREARARGRSTTWAITPRTVLELRGPEQINELYDTSVM